MKKLIRLSLILILITGCATFKSPMSGKYLQETKNNSTAGKVNVLFIFSHYNQTLGIDAIPKLKNPQRNFNDVFGDALNEISNIEKYNSFTIESSDVNNTKKREDLNRAKKEHDYIIEMTFKREKSFAKFFFGVIASSISATILPIRYKYKYSINVNVYNHKQEFIKAYTREVNLNKWIQTFMVFLYPFHHEEGKKEVLYVECMRDLFKQIETENILDFSNTEMVNRTVYSSNEICEIITKKIPNDIIHWDSKGLNKWINDKDVGIVVHIPGDELSEEMAQQTFELTIETLDNKTEEERIIFKVINKGKYPVLLISAKNETVLKSQLNINKQLIVMLNGMIHLPRKFPTGY